MEKSKNKLKRNYEDLVRSLSSAYDRRGRIGHDELLNSFKKEIGETPYAILYKVVIEEYLDRRGANRIFGAFSEETIQRLAKQCGALEESLTNTLLP